MIPGLRVGVVGHRNDRLRAEDSAALSAKLGKTLDRIASAMSRELLAAEATNVAPPILTVVSALAEGADRLGARAALDAGFHLECPLPFDRSEYERDFETQESKREFRELLDAAAKVWELGGSRRDSPAAYEAVGMEVLAHSDLLVAIWDGEEARGRGGTAQVVRAAATKMPVIWIRSDLADDERLLTADEHGSLAVHPDSGLELAIHALLGPRSKPPRAA